MTLYIVDETPYEILMDVTSDLVYAELTGANIYARHVVATLVESPMVAKAVRKVLVGITRQNLAAVNGHWQIRPDIDSGLGAKEAQLATELAEYVHAYIAGDGAKMKTTVRAWKAREIDSAFLIQSIIHGLTQMAASTLKAHVMAKPARFDAGLRELVLEYKGGGSD